ncbi:MAG: ribosome small subunit-dependent GTPase A [Spirochaetales bacterium]|nr:ribosome small subunit-dependent GTPase A [Spirochaetales bacterium]
MEGKGLVLFGVNNIYTVRSGERDYRCRIKGKIFKEDENYYNPIAVGDIVRIITGTASGNEGLITGRIERKNAFIRWNKKKKSPQVIASNIDYLIAICSAQSPPFRPRFLDRLIISAVIEEIEPVIVINKCDLELDAETKERLLDYEKNGYRVVYCSAKTGEGIDSLSSIIKDKCTVFAGQSGVGKSSLLNIIEPDLDLKVGEISSKYDRGIHTTIFSIMIILKDGTKVIDTPGIRECWIYNLEPDQLKFYFPEFLKPAEECGYLSCLHLEEPGCKVKELVEKGEIHHDRYYSYTRIMQSIIEQESF